jgi:anti-sigma factor RsiW
MPRPSEIVTVTDAYSIPVVTLPERRMTTSGKALADAILAQLDGNLPPANREQLARMVGATIGHRSSAESHVQEMAALRGALRADDDEAPSDVLENVKRFGDAARAHADSKATPSTTGGGQNGIAVALGGANMVTDGSSGTGDNWVPGEAAGTFEQHIEAEFPEASHPIRRAWSVLEKTF